MDIPYSVFLKEAPQKEEVEGFISERMINGTKISIIALEKLDPNPIYDCITKMFSSPFQEVKIKNIVINYSPVELMLDGDGIKVNPSACTSQICEDNEGNVDTAILHLSSQDSKYRTNRDVFFGWLMHELLEINTIESKDADPILVDHYSKSDVEAAFLSDFILGNLIDLIVDEKVYSIDKKVCAATKRHEIKKDISTYSTFPAKLFPLAVALAPNHYLPLTKHGDNRGRNIEGHILKIVGSRFAKFGMDNSKTISIIKDYAEVLKKNPLYTFDREIYREAKDFFKENFGVDGDMRWKKS